MRVVTKIKVYLSIDQEPQQVRFVMVVKQKIKFVNRGCSGERVMEGCGRINMGVRAKIRCESVSIPMGE